MENMPRGNFYRPESFISPASEYGLLRSATPDRTVWLYARIPWSTALLDGANDQKRMDTAQQLMAFFDGLANQVTVAGMRYRYMLQSEYREFHILAGSMPVPYRPPLETRRTELGQYQSIYYRNEKTCKQFAVVGVPLRLIGETNHNRKPGMLQRALTWYDRMCYSVANGCPMFEEYLPDAHKIERIMLNAGLEPFTLMDEHERERLVAMMESWWVGRANSSALPILAENAHVHFFPDNATCISAKNLYDEGVNCNDWGIDNEYPASICFARTSDFNQSNITDPSNLWIAKLMEVGRAGGANAVATSIRGKVEPAKVTADQIRRNSRTIDESIKERYEKNHEATGDMNEIKERLDYKKSIYETPDMPPSIIDLSIATCVAGTEQMAIDALGRIPNIEFTNLTTASEQLMAFKSMQACSNVRMTPYEIHWSATCVAGGGVSSFAKAGDKTGALAGMTEANRQSVYIGTTTVQDQDMAPGIIIAGKTGSGKSMLLVSLFLQWAKIPSRSGQGNTPCILINPKEGDDFEDAVTAMGGRVVRADSDFANGTFDPFMVMEDRERAKEMASIMLSNILHPNGDDASMELAIAAMLDYGIKHGAKATGTAITLAAKAYAQAVQDNSDPSEIGLPTNTIEVYKQIRIAFNSYQAMRLIFGTKDDIQPLRISHNLTLINAGRRSLVPEAGSENTVTGRIQQWTLRMIVLGAGASISGRDGMVGVDEAWCIGGKGKGASRTVEEWMRTARSRRFTPVFASQKTQEFVDAGMTGGVSRGFLLSLDDPPEVDGTVSPAKAAERFLQIDDTSGHIRKRMSQSDRLDNGAPNPSSLRRLVDPKTKRTIRGAVAYFKDGSNQPIPIEIVIPPDLLKDISTTATDKIAREQRKQKERKDNGL
nr:ATP-binding protein [Bifidobacterium breve]